MELKELKSTTHTFQENADKITRQTNESLLMLRAIPEGKWKGVLDLINVFSLQSHYKWPTMRRFCLRSDEESSLEMRLGLIGFLLAKECDLEVKVTVCLIDSEHLHLNTRIILWKTKAIEILCYHINCLLLKWSCHIP